MTITTDTDTRDVLTGQQAVALAAIVNAALNSQRVRRLIPDDEAGAGLVIEGTARRIGAKDTGGYQPDVDIRDQYLWVTTTTGFETWWAVRTLMTERPQGLFAVGN